MELPDLTLVCPHFREKTDWVLPLLEQQPGVSLVVYDCAVDPIPQHIKSHPRVTWRYKPVRTTLYWTYFDYCAREYDRLPGHVLFCHGHNRSWHQHLPLAHIVDLLLQLRPFDYINISDQVYSDWLDPQSVFHKSAVKFWRLTLRGIIGGEPPAGRIVDLNAGQACVSHQALRARTKAQWQALAERARVVYHHHPGDYGFEACFHVIMGQSWERPIIAAHLEQMRCRLPFRQHWPLPIQRAIQPRNELLIRAGY